MSDISDNPVSDVTENPVVRAHRDVVERLWTEPLIELCGDEFPVPAASTVLAAESRCGAVILHWLESLPGDTRLMALDPSGPMLDAARTRIDEEQQQRIYFVQQRVGSLSYADGVFDAAVCLHGMVTLRQVSEGLRELTRVISPGSRLLVAVPLRSSFREFYDLLDEALRACGLEEVLVRVDETFDHLVEPPRLATLVDEVSLEQVEISEVDWEVAFGSGREYLYSPLIQETFFPHWVGAIRASEREEVLNYIARAMDRYWTSHTIHSEVRVGLVVATKSG